MTWQRMLEGSDLGRYDSTVTLQDLIHESESLAAKDECVVCQIEVNGMKLTENDEGRLADSSVREMNSFKALGNRKSDVKRLATSAVQQSLETLETQAVSIAENVRINGINAQVVTVILRIISDLETLNTFFHRYFLESEKDSNHAKPDEVIDQNLRLLLGEIIEAFEHSDAVLLADLFEYELTKCFQDWHHRVQRESAKLLDSLVGDKGASVDAQHRPTIDSRAD